MGMTKEKFREVLENEWTVTENRILKIESTKYVHSLQPGVRPQRQEMAKFCMPRLPGRTLSAVENHLYVMGFWIASRRNNGKPKRRRRQPRRYQRPMGEFASSGRVQSTSTRGPAGRIKIVRSFQCPGCGLHSEVV